MAMSAGGVERRILVPPYLRDGLPEEVALGTAFWDSGDPEPGDLGSVSFWVPPYTATPADLSMMARMPALRVVQTLTAGVDNVLPPSACSVFHEPVMLPSVSQVAYSNSTPHDVGNCLPSNLPLCGIA